MWIRTVDESEAEGELARLYRSVTRSWGGVDHIVKAVVEVLDSGRRRLVSALRDHAGEHLVKKHAQRINVGAMTRAATSATSTVLRALAMTNVVALSMAPARLLSALFSETISDVMRSCWPKMFSKNKRQ